MTIAANLRGHTFEMARTISNTGRLFIAGAALVAAGGAAYYVGRSYPSHSGETAGTIAPAVRYQAPQVQSADVSLGDNSVPLLMQTDAFEVIVKNPSFRALAADPGFMILAQNPAALNAMARNPQAFTSLARNPQAFAALAQQAAMSQAANSANMSAMATMVESHASAFSAFGRSPQAFAAMASHSAAFAAMANHSAAFQAMASNPQAFGAYAGHADKFQADATNPAAVASMAINAQAFQSLAHDANAMAAIKADSQAFSVMAANAQAFQSLAQSQALSQASSAAALVISCDETVVPAAVLGSQHRSLKWFSDLLAARGIHPVFVGRAGSDLEGRRDTLVAVVGNDAVSPPVAAPGDFRVTAIVTAYNEADIICSTVDRLVRQQIDVVVIDNWSTDGTYELVRDRYAATVLLERFPAAPSPIFDLRATLARVEEIAVRSESDWVARIDADEIHESPWQGVDLRDALYAVQCRGFNCVDHTVLEFRPNDDPGSATEDPWDQTRYCEFGRSPGHFVQLRTWRNRGQRVSLSAEAGHRVRLDDQRPFPYKFLLRHFPLRSQAHAERKVFAERLARWDPDERAMGWHTHYDAYHPGDRFTWDPDKLIEYDDRFAGDYLVERLSGIGLPRGDY